MKFEWFFGFFTDIDFRKRLNNFYCFIELDIKAIIGFHSKFFVVLQYFK